MILEFSLRRFVRLTNLGTFKLTQLAMDIYYSMNPLLSTGRHSQ